MSSNFLKSRPDKMTIEEERNMMTLQKFAANYLYNAVNMNTIASCSHLPQVVLLQQNVHNANILNQNQQLSFDQNLDSRSRQYSNNQNNSIVNKWSQYYFLSQMHQQQQESLNSSYRDYKDSLYELPYAPKVNDSLNSLKSSPINPSSAHVQPVWMFNNRQFKDLNDYNEFHKLFNETKASLRTVAKYEDLNYLNCPYPDIKDPYVPFRYFNYAVPMKVGNFELNRPLNIEEYDKMREDFEKNGTDSSWTQEEIAERRGSTLISMNILENMNFPPLAIAGTEAWSSAPKLGLTKIWTLEDEPKLIPVHTNQAATPVKDEQEINKENDKRKKRLLKPNKKSLVDVS